MSFVNAKKSFHCLFALSFLFGIAGCDKIPFLSESFSSHKETSGLQTASPQAQSQQQATGMSPNVLVRVGSWTLTMDEFDSRLQNLKEVAPQFDIDDMESKQLILEELVRQQLLVQDAEQRGMGNKKEIADAVSEFRRTLLVREIAQQLTEGIDVDETEAREYYDQNKDLFIGETEWRVREIITFSEASAKEILIEILKGASFEEMARTRSKSQSAGSGGDLGFLKEPKFPEMGRVLIGLDVGDVSSVFKGPEGFYIVKLEEKKGGDPIAFFEVKEDVMASLTVLKQQQAILGHINKLRQATTVKVDEDLLKAASGQ